MPEDNPQAPAPFTADGQPTLQQLADYFVEAITDPEKLKRLETTIGNAGAHAAAVSEGVAVKTIATIVTVAAVPIAHLIAQTLLAVLEGAEPVTSDLAKLALDTVLGDGTKRAGVPGDVGHRVLEKLTPPNASVEPSIDGAAGYISTMVNLQMETWMLGLMAELFGDSLDMFRGAGVALDSIGELRNVVTQVFGGGRITRRVLAPFIDDSIVAPAKRWTSLQYRPELLDKGAVIEAYLRGDYTIDQVRAEVGQQGFSDARIDLLIANTVKRITLDDLFYRFDRGELADTEVADQAKALGYDPTVAALLLTIHNLKKVDQLNAPIISEATSNYLAGDIDEGTMTTAIAGAAPNQIDGERIISAAKVRRALHVKRITASELKTLVKSGVANVDDYRQALDREGYPDLDATFLELQLRVELQKEADVAKARADMDAEKAAAKLKAAADKAARDAAVAAKAAIAQFPPLSEYRKAYVRGLADREALAAALDRDGIVQDQDLYLGDADADRAAFLAAQDARDAATKKAAASGLSIATLEQAVLDGVLTLADFDANLAARGTTDDDRHTLVALLQVRIDAKAAADAQRAAAEKLAAVKGLSVQAYETAVRLGVRTLDDFRAFLATIGSPALTQSVLVDSLQAQLSADAATAAKRAAKDAEATKAGISLAERRAAVIAGVRPRDWYAQALIDLGWPVDDQLADLDLLDVQIANAAAARARRDALDAAKPDPTLSLAQLEAALKLGFITPDEFRSALGDRGYDPDDVEMILQLAVAVVPNLRDAATTRSAAVAATPAKDAPLTDLEKSVRRGLTPIASYEDELTARGYSPDAVALMSELLSEQVTIDSAGLKTKIAAAMAKTDGAPTLDTVLAAFTAGELDAAGLQGAMVEFGAPADAALVYSRLVGAGGLEG